MGVLFKNSDITVYNAYYDKESACNKYQRTVIKGVNWQDKRSVRVGDKGLISDDSILIFIDKVNEKQYIRPKAFQRLSDSERPNYFTFKNDDKVVKGIIDFELTEAKSNNSAYLENTYDDVINIISITEWTNHFEIGGK